MSEGESAGVMRAPQVVVGYHGCSMEVAEAVAGGVALMPSNNREDWLGYGIYFWEYAPHRALEWARKRHTESAVLEATIELGYCLNLLDQLHFEGLAAVYQARAEIYRVAGVEVPRNTERGAHFLDRDVIDTYCQLTQDVAPPFQTVRGCFPEGSALYPGSKILSLAHVQIAVRDPGCIKQIRRVNLPDELFSG